MNDIVLLIDDDATFRSVLARALRRRGLQPIECENAEEAIQAARDKQPLRAVLDLNLAGSSGLALIEPLLECAPTCRIVVLTGYASIATAVDAVKLGAIHYLAKPVEVQAIMTAFDAQRKPQVDATLEVRPLSIGRLEWEHIQRVLTDHNGNISETARALQMHRRTLQRKLSKRPSPGQGPTS
jgi:two-component system response regulator RegA